MLGERGSWPVTSWGGGPGLPPYGPPPAEGGYAEDGDAYGAAPGVCCWGGKSWEADLLGDACVDWL